LTESETNEAIEEGLKLWSKVLKIAEILQAKEDSGASEGAGGQKEELICQFRAANDRLIQRIKLYGRQDWLSIIDFNHRN
jgi:hypothetical protein